MDKRLRAIADAMRRQILVLVWRGERAAGEAAAECTISRPAVSQHLVRAPAFESKRLLVSATGAL
jgi:hypothetical protein